MLADAVRDAMKFAFGREPVFVREGGSIVTLIKPQFEVGRGEVGGGGIVRDAAKRAHAVETVNNAAADLGLQVAGVIESPIQGAEGNVEFLAHYKPI